MMPPHEVADNMAHPEAPPEHPCGPDTNFQYPTPMPYRFDEKCLTGANDARKAMQRAEHPIYQTTSTEVGALGLGATDLHMRWYGLEGKFTKSWGESLPKTRVNTGLNTSFDRSNIHPTYDQGWSGHLGFTDFNVANLSYAKQVVRPPRSNGTGM